MSSRTPWGLSGSTFSRFESGDYFIGEDLLPGTVVVPKSNSVMKDGSYGDSGRCLNR